MPGKRILILYNRIPYPLNDGGNIAVHAMIEGYRKEGWQVYVLAMNTSRHRIADEQLRNIYTNIYAFDTVPVNNEVTVKDTISNYLFSSLPNHAVRFNIPAFAERLREILLDFRPDVIQVESVFLSEYLPLMRKDSKAVISLRLHNIEGQVWKRLATETINPLKKIYLANLAKRIKHYEEKVWAQYDLLMPITTVDAEAIKTVLPGAKMHTVAVGIDITKVVSRGIREKWIGYHIGAMDWLPNKEAISWFIKDIWPVVHAKVPDFHFQFAGRNMPKDISLLHADGVLCVGEVSDAAAFIADKKILIVPLRSGGGIRVKILEAMGSGKLVISTTIGMQGIDAVAGQHYLLADDPQAFADAIAWALDHKMEAENMAQTASRFIKHKYDTLTLSRQLSEVLMQLLHNK